MAGLRFLALAADDVYGRARRVSVRIWLLRAVRARKDIAVACENIKRPFRPPDLWRRSQYGASLRTLPGQPRLRAWVIDIYSAVVYVLFSPSPYKAKAWTLQRISGGASKGMQRGAAADPYRSPHSAGQKKEPHFESGVCKASVESDAKRVPLSL